MSILLRFSYGMQQIGQMLRLHLMTETVQMAELKTLLQQKLYIQKEMQKIINTGKCIA